MSKSGSYRPRLAAYLGDVFVPAWEIAVEQTAYGNADTASITTWCADADLDFGAISQQGKYIPVVIKAGEIGSQLLPNQILYSYLDDIHTRYLPDTIEMTTRGVLALLIDKKLTEKSDQNVDVGVVIRKVIQKAGLTAQVSNAGVKVGKVLKEDFASMSATIKAMDYINALANGVGWKTRVVGQTVIVGPPQENLPLMSKSLIAGDLLDCDIKHSALHAHNIKVKVVSYVPKRKAKTTSKKPYVMDPYLLNGNTLNIPVPVTPAKAKRAGGTRGGNVSGSFSGAKPKDSDNEEYVFAIPGLSKDACLAKAALIQAELSRHEFIVDITFSPTRDDLVMLSQNGPEFLFKLSGASQGSHNQLYHVRKVHYHWTVEEGLKINLVGVNHLLPQDTGGLSNT